MFGLTDSDLHYIKKATDQFPEIDKVVLFGSRAMGNYKKGSDVDLALLGKNVTFQTISSVSEYVNEIYPMPYFFDVVHYNTLTNEQLKEHIDAVGIEL